MWHQFFDAVDVACGQREVIHRPDNQRGRHQLRKVACGKGRHFGIFIHRGHIKCRCAVPVEHAKARIAVLPIFQQRSPLFRLHCAWFIPANCLQQQSCQPSLTHHSIICRVTERTDILAGCPLLHVVNHQPLEQIGMRRIGDDCTRHAACPCGVQSARLPIECNTPCNRAAPIMTRNDEILDAKRVGQGKDIRGQLVGRIGIDILRL